MKIDDSIIRFVAVLIGGISILLGYLLFIKGVTGEASISVDSSSLSGQLINAAPGLFFALAGVVIIVVALIKKRRETRIRREWVNGLLRMERIGKSQKAS